MLIQNPEIRKTLIDYDFVFDFGVTVPLTLDPWLGDTIDIGDTVIKVHLSPRPSIADPSTMTSAEDLTFFVSRIALIQRRERSVLEPSPEEKSEQAKLFKVWGKPQ